VTEAQVNIAVIRVNGEVLTQGQALTVRVALINMIEDMSVQSWLPDETAEKIRSGYITTARSVLSKIDGT